jgi:hypothetical protein
VSCSRRALLGGSLAAGLGVGLGVGLGAGLVARASSPEERAQRRLDNRLELWRTFSRESTVNVLARYTSTRTSPLLADELVESGALAFVAPGTLVLRDDGVTGSTTRIEPGAITIAPNDPSLPRRPLPSRAEAPALAWLADHLVACFASGDGTALTADARTEVPRGRTPRLSLMPPRDSAARALIRSLTLTFDQVGGAVVRIEIAESNGGSFVLGISDHRQGVDPAMLARVLD